MTRRRGFGELERRSGATGPSYRARYAMPDGTRADDVLVAAAAARPDVSDLDVHQAPLIGTPAGCLAKDGSAHRQRCRYRTRGASG